MVDVDVGGHGHGPVAAVVGVHHDVGAGLGHGQLHVGERLRMQVERLAKSADGMAHDGHVLGAGRESQLDVGHRQGSSVPANCAANGVRAR